MINITFTGNIFHSDGTPAQNVKYQGLFLKHNPNSSNSIWDVTRLSETNQYNFNLGDNTWLSQQGGHSSPFDKVLLCFWLDNTSDREDTDLTEWAFIEWVLDSRDVYVQNVQLKGHQHPTCSFSLSGSHVNEPVYIIDTGSTDNYDWMFEGKEHYQSYQWDGFTIFPMNNLPTNSVTINWGEPPLDTGLPLSGSPFPHTYTTPDDYTINVLLENIDGYQCSNSFNISTTYSVNNGLLWGTPVYQGVDTTYNPNITGDLTSISGVDYYIDGVLVHQNLAYNESFDHTFQTSGNHSIRQCIKYNDGFNEQIQCEDYSVELGTRTDFVDSEYDCGLIFTESGLVGAPPVVNYQWDVSDGLFILAHVEGVGYSDWYYSWPYKGTFNVRLAVTDSNGVTSSITKEYVVNECIGDGSSTGSGGGGGSPWIYQETNYRGYDQPVPTVHVLQVVDCDDTERKNKKILILEITYDGIV